MNKNITFKKYRVNCTSLYDLVKNAKGNLPPSDGLEEMPKKYND